ncbi:MAG: FKBP-type peptidyl-prolyl cis-trans isomerase [Armatimonadota bacterium]|nr:FKBP-type peptidyl-prolyl cis-trans isomerase [bacterium]
MRTFLAILLSAAVLIVIVGCARTKTTTAAKSKPVSAANDKPAPATRPEVTTKSDKGFTKTASGLQYKDEKVGKGPAVKKGDTVTVHYKGWLDDGTVFDTSKKPGAGPFTFEVGAGTVIKGWDEGLQGMKAGGTRELIIPASLGYGDQDMGTIPPNSTLHFKVELLSIAEEL